MDSVKVEVLPQVQNMLDMERPGQWRQKFRHAPGPLAVSMRRRIKLARSETHQGQHSSLNDSHIEPLYRGS